MRIQRDRHSTQRSAQLEISTFPRSTRSVTGSCAESIDQPAVCHVECSSHRVCPPRLFCIYLQQQGVLESFYRRLRRSTAAKDSALILCQLTKTVDLDQLNSQFIDWARTQTQASQTALQEHHETLSKTDDAVSDSTNSPRVQTKPFPEPVSSLNLELD